MLNLRRVGAFFALLALAILASLGAGGQATAEKWPSPPTTTKLVSYASPDRPAVIYTEAAQEDMTITGVDGRLAFVRIFYDRQIPGTGGGDPRLVVWNDADYWTSPHFDGNRMDVRLETAPGVWQIVWHVGGDKDTWDDVPNVTGSGYIGNRYVTNSSGTPKWQLRVWGACAGSCGDYYRDAFGNVW